MITIRKKRRTLTRFVPPMLLVGAIMFGLVAGNVFSIPRFASEQGLACIDCHFSPAGGGQRNEFGHVTMSLNELTLQSTKDKVIESYRGPRISDAILTGADVRMIARDDGSTSRYQTDFYVSYQPFEEIWFNGTINTNGVDESYLMYFRESSGVFIQAGRFFPQYGLRTDDFAAFTKTATGIFHRSAREGLNVGAKLLGHRVSAAYYSIGGRWNVIGNLSRASVCGSLSYIYGFSIQHSEHAANGAQSAYSKGAYAGLGWKNFSAQLEGQLIGKDNAQLATYAGLSARIIPGLYLRGDYNFLDSDRHVQSGVQEYSRASVELWPIPFVEVNPGLTFHTRGDMAGDKDFDIRLHISY